MQGGNRVTLWTQSPEALSGQHQVSRREGIEWHKANLRGEGSVGSVGQGCVSSQREGARRGRGEGRGDLRGPSVEVIVSEPSVAVKAECS